MVKDNWPNSREDIILSPQAKALWAKTGSDEERNLWSPLYVHLGDSAFIACKLWTEWLPNSIKQYISDFLDGDDSAAKTLVSWLAGVHDIGKATPGFQYKVPERAELVEEMGLPVPDKHMVNHPFSHAYMGEAIFESWLDSRGWDYSWTYGCIVGAHHGAPPSSDQVLEDINSNSKNFPKEGLGDQDWQSIQLELLSWVFGLTGMANYEDLFRVCSVPQPVQVLVSALVIMSDWIASNSDFFPLIQSVDNCEELRARADAAWNSLSLPSAWHAVQSDLDKQELFHRRFDGLPENATLRPAQLEALHAALSLDEPGLLIIEAPMGNGKTEASLLCAEVLAAKNGSGGVAYLLPTMATSNAMFGRVEKWLEHVPDARGKSVQSMQLLHSKAALNGDFSRLRSWGSTWMGDEEKSQTEEDVIAHQWFGGRKRGLLSSFVVGTVDQLLMAALKTKHVQLRHLGLAGKVVVIDEVHAYDAYMNTYLDRVLTWLGAYGVPTILLSATLPANRRNELIHAYRGKDRKTSSGHSKRRDIPNAPRAATGNPAYPLITVATRQGELDESMYRTCLETSAGTDVIVRGIKDDDETLVAYLEDLLSDGGCACVLRDTVGRAQHTYEQLKQVFGDNHVKLVHSRFIALDRMTNDAELLRLLGPDSEERPEKLIVVGTQVIEQSLDIDFDVMFTDLAPIDLLLQRMGRLHRHQRGKGQSERPKKLQQAQCFITGVDNWEEEPPSISEGVDKVYFPVLLWKSILALRTKTNGNGDVVVNLPHDIARLVELEYSAHDEAGEQTPGSIGLNIPRCWVDAMRVAEDKLQKKRTESQANAEDWLLGKPKPIKRKRSSLIGWLRDSYTSVDETIGRAAVRDTDESIEVVAVQRCGHEFTLLPWVTPKKNGQQCTSLGDGSSAPDDETARIAANCTVSLPPRLSMPWNYEQIIDALEEKNQVPGWQESRWLRGQLPMAFDSELNSSIETDSCIYRLRYSQEAGLELIASEEKGEERSEPEHKF
ncbi:MAG: CRISPR-associated helicase Cas3' [Coriobacteriales bacterium]|jgi:CRISPR-associated endonuclease/helicase Cas3